MTDKDIKDYCKNCDVEPPAMKFKCLECEYNLNNENNFEKDINVPSKEQIMIDGVDVSGCSAYENGLCLIDKDKCNARCDYASYYLYEQLARKTAECELLETQLESYHIGETKLVQRNRELEQECEQIKEKYEALKLENQEGYEIVAELKHECGELKEKYEEIKEDRYNLNMAMYTFDRYRKALEEIEEYINNQGINNKWNMRIQRFRLGILDIIQKVKQVKN